MQNSRPSVSRQQARLQSVPILAIESLKPASKQSNDVIARNLQSVRLSYSVNEAAVLLGVSRSTVNRMIASGDLQSVTALSRRLVPKQALDQLLGG